MHSDDPILQQLKSQLEIVPILASASNARLTEKPMSGKWSAHEHLAHLARYHEVFMERLERVLAEDSPVLGRYRAEEDLNWPEWPSKSPNEVMEQLALLRGRLVRFVEELDDDQLSRRGIHPLMGSMTVRLWLLFFLFHEGHHLYTIMKVLPRQPR